MLFHTCLFGSSRLYCRVVLLRFQEAINQRKAIKQESEEDDAQEDVGCHLVIVDS